MSASRHFYSAVVALFLLSSPFGARAGSTSNASGDYIILLHGAGRTPYSLRHMESFLHACGYRTINARFPSAGFTIEQIADSYFPALIESLDGGAKIHFVAHSMGAIILRRYLATHRVDNLGRVVMLGPPNHGSEIIEHFKSRPLLRICLGPRLLELGTGPNDLPRRLGPVQFECGVIAGDRSINPLTASLLAGPNDGKVTVESARVAGMADFLIVHRSHTWLVRRQEVFDQTLCFLEFGKFDHGTNMLNRSKL